MKNFLSIFVCCIILLFARPVVSAQQESHSDWLFKRIKETETVTAHMTRADLLNVYKPVSSFGQLERFSLKSCELIVVDVIFGTANLETGSRPPDRSIPITMITPPFLVASKSVTSVLPQGSHEAWLFEKIREVESVKPGMTKEAFEKSFSMIGGFSSGNQYVLNGGGFISVEVYFTNSRNRKISSANRNIQRVATISSPYLFYSFAID